MNLALRLAAIALIAAALRGPLSARSLQISDTRRIVTVEEPAMSPDGKRVAFVAISSDYANASYVHRLFTINPRTGSERLVVTGHDVAVPRWSPDGRALAYLLRTPPKNHWQLAVRDGNGRVRIVTHAMNDVNDFAWRPDGSMLAFSAYDASSMSDYFEVGDNDYTQTTPVPAVHLWLVRPDGARTRRLTSGSWTVAPTDPGGIFTSEFAWALDGKSLYFTQVRSTFPGDDEFTTIHTIDPETRRVQKVTPNDAYELAPLPGRQGLAYSYPVGGDYLAENALRLIRGGVDMPASQSLDRNIGGAMWLPDGATMLLCGDDGPHSAAWLLRPGGAVRPLALGTLDITCDSPSSSTFDSGIAASAARDGGIAFVATDAARAPELYYMPLLDSRPRQITHFNDWLQRISVGRMTQFRWAGPKSEPENGVLTYPPNAVAGERYPLVVFPHGGPGLASIDTFVPEAWPEAQLLASHGYIVFQPNYRGSDDHGNAYMIAIERDTVRGPSDDIMSGIAAVKQLPSVDGSRVAVCGWSYGGLLTSWLIGQYHDWKAAVSGAAVNDEAEEYYLSITNVQNRYYLGERPSNPDGAKLYARESPLTYAAEITTPTLIWSTTGDPVVPTTMSYSMYHAMLDNGRPVKFLEFVAPTHGPSNPRNTEEITRAWLGWLDTYMQPREYPSR